MKVYISPQPSTYTEDGRGSGGIWRVINAQARWLPEHGVELVDNEADADIVNIHAGSLIDTAKPICTTNHGLYWTGDFDWERHFWQYNGAVIEALRRATVITVPSEWVAHPIKRDLRKIPRVIQHGINADEFEPQKGHDNYVLWAKPRVDVVCDPRPVNELARMASDIQFWTTFGRPTANVRVIGVSAYEKFKPILSNAMVWFATARETGDIGSREAMLQGIPVLGWRWGATAELVKHMETGYLATPGDYNDLREGLEYCLQHRQRLGRAARDDILERFQWQNIVSQYVDAYQAVLDRHIYPVEVSVVIPTYNYADYLDECLDSVKRQTLLERDVKIEVIVVDDASADNTQEILAKHTWPGLRTIRHEVNSGLCVSLNTGHEAARGKYIVNVDADNLLTSDALELLYDALEEKPWIDVASGGLAMYAKDGNHRLATDWPFGRIDPMAQLTHINQLTSSSMMRSASVDRLGGYRIRQHKNEDGEFWCRAISAGLRFEQVAKTPTLIYRWHDENKSKTEGGEDDPEGPLSWNFYYPWRKRREIMPFASTVPTKRGSWAVRSYDNPHIAVVIPVGAGHEGYLVDALDSVAGQTFQGFECIVANDTGKPLDLVAMGHPWVKVIDTAGYQGPAIARNTAIAAAKAPLIVPLDADDMLYPNALRCMYEAWLQWPDSLVYADCEIEEKAGGRRKLYHSGPWSWEKIRTEAVYQDTILFARQWWFAVGGYPTDQPNNLWEDWLFGVKLHLGGIGATYVEEPWGVYRHWTAGSGGRSKNDIDNADFGSPQFKKRYKKLLRWIGKKEQQMPCRGCGSRRRTRSASKRIQAMQAIEGDDVLVVYAGQRSGSWSVNSKILPRQKYRVRPGHPFTVPAGDGWIAGLPGFQRVVAEEQTIQMPNSPPQPAPMQLERQQEPPVVSFGEVLSSIVIEEPLRTMLENMEPETGGDGLAVLADAGKRIDIAKFQEAGYDTLDKVVADFNDNNGIGILAIPGIGPRTLGKIREIVLA